MQAVWAVTPYVPAAASKCVSGNKRRSFSYSLPVLNALKLLSAGNARIPVPSTATCRVDTVRAGNQQPKTQRTGWLLATNLMGQMLHKQTSMPHKKILYLHTVVVFCKRPQSEIVSKLRSGKNSSYTLHNTSRRAAEAIAL